ncbi:TP53-target gene 5 protein [Phacochoerus africanus]|uniref:TP53-target gene 5 protein n=1 Tax=Phacochoerus africanus TaxID=41426 RepID=UPI001FD9A187|nr:TP53-target gene 5 protein [Phacochoerus africanus]
MSPSAKKRPKNRVASKTQDEEPQDKTQQPVSKVIERNRLKMVLKNLSLLKLFKSSNPRIQELHNLAKRYWNSLLRVPRILGISSGGHPTRQRWPVLSQAPLSWLQSNLLGLAGGPGPRPALLTAVPLPARNDDVQEKGEQKNKELQEAGGPSQKLDSKNLGPIVESKLWKPKVASGKRHMAQEAVPQKEQRMEPEVPMTSKGHGLTTGPGAWGRQPPTGDHGVVLLKTQQKRAPAKDMEQLEAAHQWRWFEGLPTRVHLPGPRVMCRSSALRWVKRCCTRFCSASLELPMVHPYKV